MKEPKAKFVPIPIVVTTKHRGVFFGYGIPTDKTTIRITDAQMCVYWSSDIKGVLGLANTGPSKNCRIGPAIPAITLTDVTSIMETTPQAEIAWKQMPWN